jgi:hypothetical protein
VGGSDELLVEGGLQWVYLHRRPEKRGRRGAGLRPMAEDRRRHSALGGWWQDRTRHWQFHPPLKTSFAVISLLVIVAVVLVFMQFRGQFTPKTRLTMVSSRAGLVMDRKSPTTAWRSAG